MVLGVVCLANAFVDRRKSDSQKWENLFPEIFESKSAAMAKACMKPAIDKRKPV
jgi:hypothetical protein